MRARLTNQFSMDQVQSRDDYERLDDKSLAIDVVTGHVDKHLGNKLKTLCMHGKTLAVGTPQQATIIQSQLVLLIYVCCYKTIGTITNKYDFYDATGIILSLN